MYSSTFEALSGFAIAWSSHEHTREVTTFETALGVRLGVAKPKPGIAPEADALASTRWSLGAALTTTWSLGI